MTTTAHKLEDLRQRLERAQDPGSERSRKRRDDAGRSTPRQRINALLDEGSFVETGALAKTPGDPDAIYSDGVVAQCASMRTIRRFMAARLALSSVRRLPRLWTWPSRSAAQ